MEKNIDGLIKKNFPGEIQFKRVKRGTLRKFNLK